MKKLAIIPIAAIALLSSSVLSAQEAKTKRADTLRRELTVMTEEEVSLSTRQPRDPSYTGAGSQPQPCASLLSGYAHPLHAAPQRLALRCSDGSPWGL